MTTSFLYPRTIAVTRSALSTGAGKGGYDEMTPATETAVIGAVTYASGTNTFASLTGVVANISDATNDRQVSGLIPGSARRVEYKITLPAFAASLGQITERDIVTDDLGKRYQVSAATWGPLGYSLRASLLEN